MLKRLEQGKGRGEDDYAQWQGLLIYATGVPVEGKWLGGAKGGEGVSS